MLFLSTSCAQTPVAIIEAPVPPIPVPAVPIESPPLSALQAGSDCARLPIGVGTGEGYYVAQGFGPRGHLGEDWNGTGGGDTDLGDPVYAMADGVVVEALDYEGGWGNVVRVRHRLGESSPVESLYGHLDRIDVEAGDLVFLGDQLGTIGTAHGNYWAHLHFEIRSDTSLPLGPGYAKDAEGYLAPRTFIAAHGAGCHD